MPAHPAYVSQLEWQPLVDVLQAAGDRAGMSDGERMRGVHSFNDTKLPGAIFSGDELSCSATIVGVEKRPKRIIRVDALPLLPVGKVDKMVLRKTAAEQIGPELAAGGA